MLFGWKSGSCEIEFDRISGETNAGVAPGDGAGGQLTYRRLESVRSKLDSAFGVASESLFPFPTDACRSERCDGAIRPAVRCATRQ